MAVLGCPVKGLGCFLGMPRRIQPEIAMKQIAIPDKFNRV
jgi:hypothetical protein